MKRSRPYFRTVITGKVLWTLAKVATDFDYSTGVTGSAAVLHALIRRAEEGGSYGVDVRLYHL